MKITVHCEGNAKEIGKQLLEAAKVYGGKAEAAAPASEEVEETDAIDMAEIKAKRGKGKKAKPAEVDPDDESEIEEELDETESEEELDETETEEEEEIEEDEDKLSEADLAKLKAALKNYSAKVNKKKAVGILKNFAERSDLVKPADLPKLMKLLKV